MPMMSALSERAQKFFESVGAPPEDPDDLLTWGRKILANVAWLLTLDEIDQTRARSIKDAVFAIGATHNRAKLEAKVQKIAAAVQDRRQAGSAITEVAGALVARPPTARRGRPPAPRPVPEDPADPLEGRGEVEE
jgi:hypothetical protein